MGVKNIISQLIEQELQDTEYFLVGIHANAAETSIQVYVDGEHGVGIGYCAKLSRKISAALDELEMEIEADRYRYEISSPGADKPLVDIRQYPKHIGRVLDVELNGDEVVSGTLNAVASDHIELDVVDNPKQKTTKKVTIENKNIKSSTVQISFKSVKK